MPLILCSGDSNNNNNNNNNNNAYRAKIFANKNNFYGFMTKKFTLVTKLQQVHFLNERTHFHTDTLAKTSDELFLFMC